MSARNTFEVVFDLINRRTAIVGVVGLGYVGLPLSILTSSKGFKVIGFDVDLGRINCLSAGASPFRHVPASAVSEVYSSGQFSATPDMSRLAEPDILLLCVPTPLGPTREPDLSAVVSAATAVGTTLRPGQLVVLESTTYPGTTRSVVLPRLRPNGLALGEDFFLAYSPEREDPGNTHFRAEAVPKVVGGIDGHSQRLAFSFYGAVFNTVVPVSCPEVAEASKLLENSYRAVNIALANEFKLVCDKLGVDVWEVIDAAKTKPFGFQAFSPGPGPGGHCIPVDPIYFTWLARQLGAEPTLVTAAVEVNAQMPARVVEKAADLLAMRGIPLREARVLILGVAYKKDVDDVRESPGLAILDILLCEGASARFHDPFISRVAPNGRRAGEVCESVTLDARSLSQMDAAIVVTDHSSFDWEFIARHVPLLISTRRLPNSGYEIA